MSYKRDKEDMRRAYRSTVTPKLPTISRGEYIGSVPLYRAPSKPKPARPQVDPKSMKRGRKIEYYR